MKVFGGRALVMPGRLGTSTGSVVARSPLCSSRSRRVLAVAAIATFLTFAIALAGARPAHANNFSGSTSWGAFEWYDAGETIVVHDYASNGRGTAAEIRVASSGSLLAYCINRNGYTGPPETCRYDSNLWPENMRIKIRLEEVTSSGSFVNVTGWWYGYT